jgi:hypothetical protein
MLLQKWKLAEVYEIDSLELVYDKHALSAIEHRKLYQFNLRELRLDYQILQFTRSEQAFFIEKALDFDSHTRQLGHFSVKNNILKIEKDNAIIKILVLAPNLVILGKNGNRIEVYTPILNDIEDLHLPDDYIWEYYKMYFPNKFKRLEEG